jgi:succinoglycan biosynthesis transport protein ExoP
MTTLPQTTPIRLPRPAGGTALAVPTAAISVPSAPVAPPMSGADVWRVIRANMWLIIVFVVAFGVGGYFLNTYLAKNDPVYTTTGLIRTLPMQAIDPLRATNAGVDIQALFNDQHTEAALLMSEGLVNQVLMDPSSPIRQTTWWTNTCGGDPQRARGQISSKFVATPKPDSQLITVAMSASNPQDAVTIATAMVEQAIANNKEFISRKNEADRNRILEMENRYQLDLRTTSKTVEELSAQLNLSGMGTAGGISAKEVELEKKVEALLLAQSQVALIDSQLGSFENAVKQDQLTPKAQQLVDTDDSVMMYKRQRDNTEAELAIATNQSGSSNPTVLALQKQLDVYQQKYDDAREVAKAQAIQSIRADLTAQRDLAHKSLENITADVDGVKKEMAELSNKMALYQSRREEEQRDRDEVQQYERAKEDMEQMVRQADFSSLDWAQRPTEPDAPSFPKLPFTMGVALTLGLALSLGIAFLREVTDTTVRSPRDIQRVGQMTLLGMVPHEADDPQSAGARLPLVIFEAPHSIMAEQLRQVRTRLQHAASLDTTRSILVTSPSPDDGKSTIACNLAAGLALNGRRILLVDSNFRRPELHRIFGIGNEVGFADVLNDVNAFESVVRETPVPNLSVIASGPKPSNPTELLESQLLLDFIERALEEYDHVIFDSGPMLFVSDSMALAPRVDGVVTVVKARSNSRGVLTRMRDGLRSVKAEHLGVVLNGVRNQSGGYYGRSIKTYYAYQDNA